MRITACERGSYPANAAALDLQGSALPKRHATTWAQRLKRVFGIEIESCEHCGGAVKIIASIEDPQAIGRILEHLELDCVDRQVSPHHTPDSSTIRPRFRAPRNLPLEFRNGHPSYLATP